ncbi:hypothetical protein [Methylobacterium sp. SI9]|uniref:hypothetical protein n=1 Tax=Methylobacterium guangdongense TaxID=3138811 RepID=UPI00313DDBE0
MIHVPPPDHDDTLESLLCEALDAAAADPVRVALLTRLCLMTADFDRDADLERLRLDGLPQVFRA